MFVLFLFTLFLMQDGKPFRDAVFNETVQLAENDDGMDGET